MKAYKITDTTSELSDVKGGFVETMKKEFYFLEREDALKKLNALIEESKERGDTLYDTEDTPSVASLSSDGEKFYSVKLTEIEIL